MAGKSSGLRRDKRHRVLKSGESIRANGKYQYKYLVDGKPKFVYSWKLEPTDPLPAGKKPCLSLRELEKQVEKEIDSPISPLAKKMTVLELAQRYVKTKVDVRPNTKQNYAFVLNLLAKEEFSNKIIANVKTSDAKLFMIKLQEEGKGCSTIKCIRGVLRPAFQMAVDDDMLVKNPFCFQFGGVVVNDAKPREALDEKQMESFLRFVHDDYVYCKYYETMYILFHTGLRISEFCGLTDKDIDFENMIIDVNKQLHRDSKMNLMINPTKTNAGTRKLPMTEDVAKMFMAILQDREMPRFDKGVDGYKGFLFYYKNGLPEVAMHWEHRIKNMKEKYNKLYKLQIPALTPHICRHTYCTNMARAGMNPKTLQYLMGHSDISITMNVYTHLGLNDAKEEMIRMEELNRARDEMKKEGKVKPVSQKMFRVV